MHMQVEHTQGKLVRVTAGAVFDVMVDLRSQFPFLRTMVGYRIIGSEPRHGLGAAGPGAWHAGHVGVG